MKHLNRILLVNWYLLGAEQIDIQGYTAFIGPNAAGKSSILDAIQTVLLGGNRHLIQLNASAGEKSKRSLREYCLGVVRDPNSGEETDPDLAPRRQAITYLVLCFRDDETDEETAVGLAMHASLDNAVFEVDGRFIVPRASLILRDFIEATEGGERPIPWERVREDLRRRCHAQHAEFENYNEAERFVKRLGEALGYGGRSFEPTRFARSLRNAVTFAPIKDVSDFVRRHILDDKPIRVKALQESLKRYRDIEAKTKEVRDRIEALKIVRGYYQEAARAEHRISQYDWIEMEAQVLRLDDERTRIEDMLNDLGQRDEDLTKKRASLVADDENDQKEIIRLTGLIEASGSEAKLKELNARIGTQELIARQVGNDLDAIRRKLSGVWRLLDEEYRQELPKPLLGALEALAETLPRDELLAALWPEDPEHIEQQAGMVLGAMGALGPTLQEQTNELRNKVRDIEAGLNALREKLDALKRGETLLSRKTQALTALLDGHGVSSRPLCDLVEITEDRWRDTIERYLGNLREALIVSPDHARDAITIYRRQGRELFGARVVNTRKTQDWIDRCEPGSLAEMVTTDDVHARAYVNRLLGRVMRVETEEELLRHERAATDDGMLSANGAIERMAPVVDQLLGRASRELTRRRLEKQFHEDASQYNAAKQAFERSEGVVKALSKFVDKLDEGINLAGPASKRAEAAMEMQQLQDELGKLDLSEIMPLRKTLGEIGKQLETRKARHQELDNQRRQLDQELGAQKKQQEQNSVQLEEADRERTLRSQVPGLDMAEAANHLERMLSELDEDFARVEEAARVRAGKNRRDRNQGREAARTAISEYVFKYSALLPSFPEQDQDALHAELERWTLATLFDLEETQLASLTDRAEKARQEAENIFHSKFIGLLRDNLASIEDALDELNRNLKKRAFHGEIYQFKRFPEKDFDPLIKWVESATAADQANVGGLFDTQAIPGAEHYEARKKVREMLLGDVEGARTLEEKLADYRNYYRFDVEMRDPERSGSTAWLSNRLGKGSGGEHQAPFYVAIGAALAATYRLERDAQGAVRGGMALALFDEAFSKLDVHNTLNALAFLRDLGMQAVIAAPDERHALLAEEMDTIVNVYRDGGAVSIDAQYLKAPLHALLARDNPFKHANE